MEIKDLYVYVIDTETTNEGFNGSPSAQYRNNEVLVASISIHKGGVVSASTGGFKRKMQELENLTSGTGAENILICGHNLKFDLEYMMRERPDLPWENYKYWCTAQAYYLHSGHRVKFPSLEDTYNEYVIHNKYKKSLDLSELLKNSTMRDIDINHLIQYVREDQEATYSLFNAQIKTMSHEDIEFIMYQCAVLPAIASIELNGMCLDRKMCAANLIHYEKKMAVIELELKGILKSIYGWSEKQLDKLNVTSNRTVSSVLTGFPHKIEVGTKKADKETLIFNRPLFRQGLEPFIGPPNDTLGYSVKDDVIATLPGKFPKYIREYRHCKKLAGTYLSTFIERTTDDQPLIFTNIHLTSTGTGRTSSSSPNFQNMPPEARRMFKARKDDFYVLEIDFKQLEVCAIAHLSQDPVLIEDICNKVDIHYQLGIEVFGWKSTDDMTEANRRVIKAVVFGMLYGGGAKTLAKEAGIRPSLAKLIIDAFFKRYKGVAEWHTKLLIEAEANSFATIRIHRSHVVKGTYLFDDSIGRRWYLEQQPTPKWMHSKGVFLGFPPTQIVNYKPQGFAGGDIVLSFLRALFIRIGGLKSDKILLTNTIHDSILCEVHKDLVDDFLNYIQPCIRFVENLLELKVPLTVEIKSANRYWK